MLPPPHPILADAALRFYNRLAPGRITAFIGDSRATVPTAAMVGAPLCDILVVDGDHTLEVGFGHNIHSFSTKGSRIHWHPLAHGFDSSWVRRPLRPLDLVGEVAVVVV